MTRGPFQKNVSSINMSSSDNSEMRFSMDSNDDSMYELQRTKRFKNDFYKEYLNLNKSRIYNIELRKKPAELVRKDLISAMKYPDHEVLKKEDFMLILDHWSVEWEKGVQIPVNPESLPKPKIIKSHLQHVTPHYSESDLARTSIKVDSHDQHNSYELDLKDICWLNSLRDSELNLEITENFLEYVLDKLEQTCAANMKAHNAGIEYDDHIVCDVCKSPDGEDGNEMVFCDLCNICVHQACYGIIKIPEGDWHCRPCEDNAPKKCILCSNTGGALKPTKCKHWAHVSCAYWIPEAKFTNFELLEPVEINRIPTWRWNLVCSLCNIKHGAPIICDEKNCRVSYHVTCAFKHKLTMKAILMNGNLNVKFKSFCPKHSKTRQSSNKNHEIDYVPTTSENDQPQLEPANKSGAQNEFWKYVDINEIYQKISDEIFTKPDIDSQKIVNHYILNGKSLKKVIELIHNYWKLKRVANFGNSLIKLTFAQKFEEQMSLHHEQIINLRLHLERLRNSSYMAIRREKIKLNWLQTHHDIVMNILKLPVISGEAETPSLEENELSLLAQTIKQHNIYSSDDNNTEPKSTKSKTNELIRKLKVIVNKLNRTRKVNPYAKTYSNSMSKRKGDAEDSPNPTANAANKTPTNVQPEVVHKTCNGHLSSSKRQSANLIDSIINTNSQLSNYRIPKRRLNFDSKCPSIEDAKTEFCKLITTDQENKNQKLKLSQKENGLCDTSSKVSPRITRNFHHREISLKGSPEKKMEDVLSDHHRTSMALRCNNTETFPTDKNGFELSLKTALHSPITNRKYKHRSFNPYHNRRLIRRKKFFNTCNYF